MKAPLFSVVGGRYVPSDFARGPWDPSLLHGGAVGALAAELLQQALDSGYQPVRLTLDLVRPVPQRPLEAEVEVVRTGARLGVSRVAILVDGKASALATLAAIRPVALEGAPPNPATPPPDRPADAVDLWGLSDEAEAFIGGGMRFRFVRTSDTLAGGVAWLHLHRPVLPDAPPSPLARVAAAADIPSAVSRFDGIRYPGVGFINADVDFHLHRPLEGEWVRITSVSRWEATGIGNVSAALGDAGGSIGRIGQALILADGLTPP